MTQSADPRSGTDGDEPGYAAAVAELEAILDELERDDVDVDVLGARVARAAELIAVCRDRIDAARFQVDQIVNRLPTGTGTATSVDPAASASAPTPPEATAAPGAPAGSAEGPEADVGPIGQGSTLPGSDGGAPADGPDDLLAAYAEPDVDGAGA